MSFEFSDETLRQLFKMYCYQIPEGELVFFGLRGCLPVNDFNYNFADSHSIKKVELNYTHIRCTIGQWDPDKRMLAVFPASTVPLKKNIASVQQAGFPVWQKFGVLLKRSHLPRGAKWTNQLLPGYYSNYFQGIHPAKKTKPRRHRAFRQHGRLPVLRTYDDLTYENTDFFEIYKVYDNLHCAHQRSILKPGFASSACQVILGTASLTRTSGPWKTFQENAYLLYKNQKKYRYALFNGHRVQPVAEEGLTNVPHLLQFGSSGKIVSYIQNILKQHDEKPGREMIEGHFGENTLLALRSIQKKLLPREDVDGVFGPQTAEALELEWPMIDDPAWENLIHTPLSETAPSGEQTI